MKEKKTEKDTERKGFLKGEGERDRGRKRSLETERK